MRNQTLWALRACCVVGIVLLLGAVLLPSIQTVRWVGSTDLTVEFVVTDAETGEPIPGAEISIQPEVGVDRSGIPKEGLKLSTQETGTARYLCRDTMCSGTNGPFWFTRSFGVRVPDWIVIVEATHYAEIEPLWISASPATYRRTIERDGPKQARLIVPISLRKVQP
jgi:hypothetical protein